MLRVCLGDRELVMYLYLEASKHIFFYMSWGHVLCIFSIANWGRFDADLVQI